MQFFSSSTANLNKKVKVTHRDHHMYDVDSNVTIAGASSGITTTLNGAITNSATSLTPLQCEYSHQVQPLEVSI